MSGLPEQQLASPNISGRETRSRTAIISQGTGLSALRAEQLELFNSLRIVEGRVTESSKLGNHLHGARGLGRLQFFFDMLFDNLRVTDPRDSVLAHEFLIVFHAPVDAIDYGRPSLILDVLEDPENYTIWRATRLDPSGSGYSCVLFHGREAWFGKRFLLADDQTTLPDLESGRRGCHHESSG